MMNAPVGQFHSASSRVRLDALNLAEMLFATLGFIILIGALNRIIEPPPPLGMRLEESPRANLAAIAVFVVSSGLLAVRLDRYANYLISNAVIFVPVIFALFSVFWSIDPEISRNRAIALIGTTIFGCYIGIRFSFRELALIIFLALGFSALGSFISAVLVPSFGVVQINDGMDHHAGHWRGLYGHRIKLAQAASLMVITTVALWRMIPFPAFAKLVAVLTAVLCIIGSRSAQGIIATTFLTIFILFYRAFFALPIKIRVFSFLTVVAVAIPLLSFMDEIIAYVFALAGRTPDMSARTYIWESAWIGGLQRPLLGGGYQTGWAAGAVYAHLMRFPSDVGHAHNGYLTQWLDLGVLGLASLVPLYIMFFQRLLAVRQVNFSAYIYSTSFIIFYFLINYVDSVLMSMRDPIWILLITLIFMNKRVVQESFRVRQPKSGLIEKRSSPHLSIVSS